MGDIWLTSDHHFGHESKKGGIIAYCKRPFTCVEEMDDVLIGAWNTSVGRNDTVYHLGDFTLNDDARPYFKQLNGKIKVLGYEFHHDRRWLGNVSCMKDVLGSGVHILGQVVALEELAGPRLPIILCHFPFARWDRAHFGSFHCHGHCHSTYQSEGLALDVGVDNIYKLFGEYRPIHLDEVREFMEGRG